MHSQLSAAWEASQKIIIAVAATRNSRSRAVRFRICRMIRLEIRIINHIMSKHADRNRVESCSFGIISYRLGVNSNIVFEKI